MYVPEDEQSVIQSFLSHMATFRGISLALQRLCVSFIHLRKEQLFSTSRRVFTYTFSLSLSYHSSTVLVFPSKILMPSGLFYNDSLNRKNKFLRKSKESTATLCSPLGTVRKPCDAHSAAQSFSYSMNVQCTAHNFYKKMVFIFKYHLKIKNMHPFSTDSVTNHRNIQHIGEHHTTKNPFCVFFFSVILHLQHRIQYFRKCKCC